MKKRITLLAILQILIFTGLCNSQITFNKFYLGTFTFPNMNSYHNPFFFNKYDSLMYNLMVGYIGHYDIDSGCGGGVFGKIWGGFYDEINSSGYTTSLYPTIENFNDHYQNKGGFSLFLEREKILRPAYGQSSRHEAEYDPTELENGTIRPAYGFKTVYGNIYQDPDGTKGRVLYANGTPGYFVKGMYENLEQVNVLTLLKDSLNRNLWYNMGDRKDFKHKWFIKPRIRIDSAFAANNLYTPVVAIVIKDFNGDRIDSTILNCINFGEYKNNTLYYDGKYIERFYKNFLEPFYINERSYDLGIPINKCSPDASILDDCKMDYQIYWFGNVTTWLDCIKIEDSWGHALLTDPTLLIDDEYEFRRRITQEVSLFEGKYGTVPKFYVDEFNYNMIPCIHFVDSLVKAASNNPSSGVVCLLNDFWTREKCGGLKKGPKYSDNYSYLFKPGTTGNILLTEIYPFDAILPLPTTIPTLPSKISFPETKGYHYASSNNVYNDSLYLNLETGLIYPEDNTHPGHVPSFMDRFRKCSNEIKQTNKFNSFIVSVPFHTEENPYYDAKMREPTTEEMSMMSYLSMAYGANGVLQFSFNSKEKYDSAKQQYYYYWGIEDLEIANGGCDNVSNNRNINYYGQSKYAYILKLDTALRKIGDFMYDNNKGNLIYDDTRTINTKFGSTNDGTQWGLPFKYIQDIQSVYYNPSNGGYNSANTDPTEKRYWEFGFFNPRQSEANDYSKYFLALNKRCSPGDSITGDYRQLRVKFSPSQLYGFNNWVIKDAVTNKEIVTFDKNTNNFVTVGEFRPGEGKLLKLSPVMIAGGTFVCNEDVSPLTFVCDSTVFNNGYTLTLYQGTKIMFKPKGKIVFNGGSFYSGYLPQGPIQMLTEFCGNGNSWEGISFQGNSDINISHSIFKNIAYEPPEGNGNNIQNCAINLINCNNFSIQSSSFYSDNKAGAIYYQYSDDSNPNWQNTYIGANNFIINEGNTSSPLLLSFNSLSAIQMPLRIEGNFFNNIQGVSAIAIYINGISGGSVKNNTIHRFSNGLIALSSSLDLYNNTFYSNISSSKSVQGYNGSNINLSPSAQYYTGGSNRITSMNNESINLYTDNSFVFLDKGENSFNISPAGGNSPYHIYGTFPSVNIETYQATYNCFKIDSVNTDPVVDVTAGGNPVIFNFDPYSCSTMLSGDYEVFTFAGLINDTIAVRNIGTGGSERGTGENISDVQVSPCKSLSDSININMRKRQYPLAEVQCKRMITLYSDSSKVFDAVSKLYFVSLSQDSAGFKMGAVKTFYENVILNNQGKVNLINRCFYLIQKCKVALKQFTSALDGFQLIMQQNPFTYEGLCASWDYAATHLLDSIHGSGGALSNNTEEKQLTVFDLTDRYDSTKFTKKQRNDISKTVNDVLESKRITQTEKIIQLQKKTNEGSKEAAKELKVMKILNEVVKKKTPNNHIELAQIIQNDIKKVFGSKGDSKETQSILPQTYTLYQNYPNPFNPSTKIAYDIPRDAKVKLVIYDILGREMKTLVNNEFRPAGKYITEFNGSNLASGIYFARILVNEGKDFMAVKKMVLVK